MITHVRMTTYVACHLPSNSYLRQWLDALRQSLLATPFSRVNVGTISPDRRPIIHP